VCYSAGMLPIETYFKVKVCLWRPG
jgi:hypothetical protein